MWNPADYAIRNPLVVVLGAALIAITGTVSYLTLPRQENPRLTPPYAAVFTYLPGASPEQTERLLTRPLEDWISRVDDIERISSVSGSGRSHISVKLAPTADIEARLEEIQKKVEEARSELPPEAGSPKVNLRVLRTNTVILALVHEGASVDRRLLDRAKDVERLLGELSGVRRVETAGLPREEVEVAVDLQRLAQHELNLSDVISTVEARNVRSPSGEVEVGGYRFGVRTGGGIRDIESVEAALLPTRRGLPVRIGDLATVRRRIAEPDVLVNYSGKPAVALGVEILPSVNALRFGARVREFVEEVNAGLPSGMRLAFISDEPSYIASRLGLLERNVWTGMALVAMLSLIGLGLRSGLSVIATIPLSLAASVAVLGWLGYPLHQISIAALVVSVGLVVDESIVVVDSIAQRLEKGDAPAEAGVRGLGEVHVSILAGMLTTSVAFVPLMLMPGETGEFLRSIPIVIGITLACSLVVAHFFTPWLAVIIARAFPMEERPAREVIGVVAYRRLVSACLERPWLPLLAVAVAVPALLSFAVLTLMPPAFFPDADRHQFIIDVELPSGAHLQQTRSVVEQVEGVLGAHPSIEGWASYIGSSSLRFYYNETSKGQSESIAQLVVNTEDSLPFDGIRPLTEALTQDLRARIAGATIRIRPLRQGYISGNEVDIYVLGDELDVLKSIAREVLDVVGSVPGVDSAWDSFGVSPLEVTVEIDDTKAQQLGFTHAEVSDTLRAALDGIEATSIHLDGEEVPIVVRSLASQRKDASDVIGVPMWSRRAERAVPLRVVASLEAGASPETILHYNREREARISAQIVRSAAVSDVTSRIERAVEENVRLPDDYEIRFFGQQDQVNESFERLVRAAGMAVLLIYAVLVLRFSSLSYPILIVAAVPISFLGSMLGLIITGEPLSLMAILGMVALTGIAVNDSIVLVDTIRRLHEEGSPLREAILAGVSSRLRPVVMTSATTMLGLTPLALAGSDFWTPYAVAMIFGLVASTVFTLVFVPCAFAVLRRLLAMVASREGRPGIA